MSTATKHRRRNKAKNPVDAKAVLQRLGMTPAEIERCRAMAEMSESDFQAVLIAGGIGGQAAEDLRTVFRHSGPMPAGHAAKTYHDTFRPLNEIFPSPENEKLYRPIDVDDPATVALAESIDKHGIREAIVITVDGWILSGHRRYVAARLAGLSEAPCRVEPVWRLNGAGQVNDDFLKLLREYNRQRVKTLDEQLREAVVEADPNEAYEALIDHRRASQVIVPDTIDIRAGKPRAKISKAKRPFLDAVKKIVSDLQEYWPLSDRRIHYLLANDPPLIHASKPESVYGLNAESYRAVTRLLTAARFEGEIPWEAIGDDTRPVTLWNVHNDPQTFLAQEINGFLKGYWRNLMQSQPSHIEITGEKNTIGSIIRPIAARYTIPVTLGRGFCSSPPRHDMAVRFHKSGKDRLVILLITDLDPSGQEIAHSFARSMQLEFHIENVAAIQVALTYDQVQQFHLPSGGKVKEHSQGRARFVEQYGDDVYELETLPPETLQDLLQSKIDDVIDVQAFNHEVDREREDAAFLDNVRRRAQVALMGIRTEGPADA
jgi:hypothetical protein